MIDKRELEQFVEQALQGTDYFPVEVKVTPSGEVTVEIDNAEGVDIDFCCELSRRIEEAFPRDEEDYSLEVGSAGLTAPFKVIGQYQKNLGGKIEVLTTDGRKLKGVLDEVNEDGIVLGVETKVKEPGMKRPEIRTVQHPLSFEQIKKANALIEF